MDLSRRRLFFNSVRSAPFRPPWSLPESAFVGACTRCDACIKECPTGLLQRGDGGFPVAEFAASACSFCGECAKACTAKAISREQIPVPWSFSIKIADDCLAYQRVECRVCGELCETGAIRFRPTRGGISRPDVDSSACSGCGACFSPCPVGAITRVSRPSLSMELS